MGDGLEKPKKSQSEEDEKLLKDVKSRFMRAFRAKEPWIKEKRKWSEFYDGHQWTEEEKQTLRERNQPDVVINRIKPKIDSIIGMELAMPVNTRAYPRASNSINKFEEAKHISEALRKIEHDSNFDTVENHAFGDQIIDGLAWYETSLTWDGLDAETRTIKLDNEDVFEDPDAKKPDLSDAKDISKSKWMHLEDAIELWAEAKEDLEALVLHPQHFIDELIDPHFDKRPDQYKGAPEAAQYLETHFVDKKLKRVRITQTYYRTPYKESFLTAPDLGEVIVLSEVGDEKFQKKAEEMFKDAIVWHQIRYKLHSCIFAWNRLLEKKLDIRAYDPKAKFPITMVPGFRDRTKPNRYYGPVAQMMDPQKEVNKRRSKMLHILNSNQLIMEDGAVKNVEEARRELAKPDGVIVVQGNANQYRFEVHKQTDIAASQFQLLQESKVEIDQVGVRSEIEGQSRATSGRDFELRQQQAVQSLRQLLSNLRDARRQVAELWLDDIQQYWTAEMFVKLTDDPNSEGIVLNQKVTDPITGETQVLNDVSVGKYDIIIDESPESINLESENFEQILKLAEIGAKTGQLVPFDMIVELSPFPNKKKLLERLLEQQQQRQQQMQMLALQAQAAGQQRPQ